MKNFTHLFQLLVVVPNLYVYNMVLSKCTISISPKLK